ncbi:MAG: DUF885 domain-containing protein [Mycobacteriales bacterium]
MTGFSELADTIVDELLASQPTAATFLGDHRFDAELEDLSDSAVRAEADRLRRRRDELAALAASSGGGPADAEERVDLAQLGHAVDARLFALTELREHEWDPLVYNPGYALNLLVAREHAPAAERLEALAGRLAAIPDLVATARRQLTDCPAIHTQTAVDQLSGTLGLVRDEIGGMLDKEPNLRPAVDPARKAAFEALTGLRNWLRDSLPAASRDPRLGRALYERKLAYSLDSAMTARETLDAAYAALDRVSAEIAEVAAELAGEPVPAAAGERAALVRRVLDDLAQSRPDDSSIVGKATAALADTTAFVRDRDLVTVLDDPIEVIVMPEFARGVAVAYCDAPGPLETSVVPTFYAISPTPKDWSPERVASFYREYNDHQMRNMTVHEAMPGHALQLAHARRYRGSSRARAFCSSGSFVEGWAVYGEQVMAAAGYGGLPVRMQQLKLQLRMVINAILDQLTHCEGLAEEDAMALMTGRGFQEEGEAAGKWRRAQLTSAQLSTYFVGYTEVSAIGAARPAGTGLREWHDAMVGHGSPAPRHLRQLLTESANNEQSGPA